MKKFKFTLGLVLSFLLLGASLNNAFGQFPSANVTVSVSRPNWYGADVPSLSHITVRHQENKLTGIISTNGGGNFNKNILNDNYVVDELIVSFDFDGGKELMPYVRRTLTVNGNNNIYLGGMQVADEIVDKGDFTDKDGTAVYTYRTDLNALLSKYPNLTGISYEIWLNNEMSIDPGNPNGEANAYPGILRPYTLNLADGIVDPNIALQGYTESNKKMTFQVSAEPGKKLTVGVTPALPQGLKGSAKESAQAGVYDVVIPIVNTAIEINIAYESSSESGEVGNAAIAADAVWGSRGTLVVNAAKSGVLSVYSITGQLIKQEVVSGGKSITLPRGIYIVKLNGVTSKVLL
ncbi:MAG: T9SS type A sorting domain-containing protein [Tannerella sp.]|jgi:hypothetical protein|nr:T9SS type A sorting domain-containing protein [Tannerella sp.]